MAKAPSKKTAKKSATTSAKAAKKAAKPKVRKAPAAAEETEPGVGAAGVEEPQLHEPATTEPEAEEPDMADEPEGPADEDPEASPAPVPEGAHWAEKVTAARSQPVHVEEPEPEVEDSVGTVQLTREEALGDNPIHLEEDAPAEEGQESRRAAPPVAQATGEVTIPEQFLAIAIDGQWDDRMERVGPGRMGAALAGSVLLELAVLGKLRVQRDHFTVEEGSTGDADLDAFAAQVQALGPIPTAQAIRKLGKKATERIRPWKARAGRRGWLREERRRFLGVFPRSTTSILDEEVQGKLQNRLMRMLAGGGNPDVKSIALLGLIQSAGLLGQMVPSSALAFNEKRISLLLSGRDPLHYRVDTSVRQVQDACLRTILADVRKLR
jgi:hypothetical protein